jgi:hypothetical protein
MWLPTFLLKKKQEELKPFIEKEKQCKTCHTETSNEWYGEFMNGKWVYWCGKCYRAKFIADIRSSPTALAKYYNIYGKSPEEVINKVV